MQDTLDTIVAHNLGEAQSGFDMLKFFGKWIGIALLMFAVVGVIALYAIKTNLI